MTTITAITVGGCRAPLALLEQVSYAPDELADRLPSLLAASGAAQLAVLSTCQRTEAYAAWTGAVDHEGVISALAVDRGCPPGDLAAAATRLGPREAPRHLLRVAAGLESFVVGEAEVAGQVRRAARAARAAGTTGVELDRLLDAAVHASRRVLAGTNLATGSRSVSTAAVDAAASHLGGLRGRHVLVVGAGEAAAAAVRGALAAGASVSVCNRSRRRAGQLAGAGVDVLDIAGLGRALSRCDVALLATSAPHPLVDVTDVTAALRLRRRRPLLLVDLSLPRNVAPAVRRARGVTLLDLADLRARGTLVAGAYAQDLTRATALVEVEVARYETWRQARDPGSATDDPHAARGLGRPSDDTQRRQVRPLQHAGDEGRVHAADQVAV